MHDLRSGIRAAWLLSLVAVLALNGCSSRDGGELTATLAPILPTPTLTPTLAPTPTASPLPTSTPTPTSTPDLEAVAVTGEAGRAQLQSLAGDARLVCLRYEDVDADGAPEWIALTHQESGPASRLGAYVLDGDVHFTLEAAPPGPGTADVGFGQYATCEIVTRDINADGIVEIAISGHADGNRTLLHVFAWDGAGYRRLGFFYGNAGVRIVDVDGDLEEEIWEGHRIQGAPSLTWNVVFTWENDSYGWTSEHYDWYFADRPQAYPTHGPDYAVIAYYLALGDRDLPGAYDLLSPQTRAAYESWALGYATTMRVSAGSAHTIPGTVGDTTARVAVMVRAWDNEGGVLVGRLWNVEWDTVQTDAGWRLSAATSELLEEWTVSYWP